MEIMATVSFKTFDDRKVQEIISAGANVLRYNIAHGTRVEILARLSTAKNAITKAPAHSNVRLLIDIPGTKPRIGSLAKPRMEIRRGEHYTLIFGLNATQSADIIPVLSDRNGSLSKGALILVGDGEMAFNIADQVSDTHFTVVARTDGSFGQGESLCLYGNKEYFPAAPDLSPTIIHILDEIRPDYIALSFCNYAADLEKFRRQLTVINDYRPNVMAKIETQLGVDNIQTIVAAADSIMVGRGDLALYSPFEQLFGNQNVCILTCKEQKKECWVGTQALDSAANQFIPSRSNICDVAYLASTGAHGLLLSRETGLADNPAHVIEVARAIIDAIMRSEE